MFEKATPESVGIPSKNIKDYLERLNRRGLLMHDIVIARDGKLFTEAFWKPFKSDMQHRMYSQTKSYVGIAVCLLAEEGKISLDDRIIDYFKDKLPEKIDPYLENQTIRDMLTMQTAMNPPYWFSSGTKDRVEHYFKSRPVRPSGTCFIYDSDGSFILGALVERLTGMTFLDYLRTKCLDKIGFSKDARCLKAPGGHSWADSALLCTPLDMLKFGYLIGNNGNWFGEQIISEDLVKEAVALHSDSCEVGPSAVYSSCGYGYQIWRFYDAVAFNGMHDQLMIHHPKTGITFVCNCGNTGSMGRMLIVEYLFSEIIEKASDTALPENKKDYGELCEFIDGLELFAVDGAKTSPIEDEINGKTFTLEENRMGLKKIRLDFNGDEGTFSYTNANGDKVLKFKKNENVFQQFPEEGYSKDIGTYPCEGNTYKCAVSGAWGSPCQFRLLVQIIDDYIGILHIYIGFNKHGQVQVRMEKHAEDFIKNYGGEAVSR